MLVPFFIACAHEIQGVGPMTAPVRCSRTAYAMENVCGLHGELQNTRARTPRSKNTDQSRSVALDSEDGKKPGPSHGTLVPTVHAQSFSCNPITLHSKTQGAYCNAGLKDPMAESEASRVKQVEY